MVESISKAQNKKLHMLLGKLKVDQDTKRDLIYRLTLGRTESAKELSQSEGNRLISELNRMMYNDSSQTMRRKIFSICHELGWHIPGTMTVDQQRLHAWLMKYGYHHKPLMQYTASELPMLVTQFEEMLKKSYHEKNQS